MSFERDVSLTTFRAFARPCTLAGEPGLVIIDRQVSYLDEDGQVRDRITQASFEKTFAKGAKHGDILVDEHDATYRIGRRETDDGHIVMFEVAPEKPQPEPEP